MHISNAPEISLFGRSRGGSFSVTRSVGHEPGDRRALRFFCSSNLGAVFVQPAPRRAALRLLSTAMKLLCSFIAFAVAAAEPTLEALEVDDACAANGDCSLELNQLRGMKVNYHDVLMAEDEDEDVDEEVTDEEGGVGGACSNPKDMGIWKGGGRMSFDGALNQCGRSCAAGFPCTQGCMQQKGYSQGCAACMAHLVECSRDKCMNQCISNDKSAACTGCVKKGCRPSMKKCSGLNAGGK